LISFKKVHTNVHIYPSFVAMLSLNAAKRITIFPRGKERWLHRESSGSGSGGSSASCNPPDSKCNKNALGEVVSMDGGQVFCFGTFGQSNKRNGMVGSEIRKMRNINAAQN
jgi:hypothetical protein